MYTERLTSITLLYVTTLPSDSIMPKKPRFRKIPRTRHGKKSVESITPSQVSPMSSSFCQTLIFLVQTPNSAQGCASSSVSDLAARFSHNVSISDGHVFQPPATGDDALPAVCDTISETDRSTCIGADTVTEEADDRMTSKKQLYYEERWRQLQAEFDNRRLLAQIEHADLTGSGVSPQPSEPRDLRELQARSGCTDLAASKLQCTDRDKGRDDSSSKRRRCNDGQQS